METPFHHIIWTVQRGNQRGRTLWFPTINIPYTDTSLADGVYKLTLRRNNTVYAGVGTHFQQKQLFEAHLFSFAEDLYGEPVEIVPLQKLRDNQHFASKEELINQIQRDCEAAFLRQRTVLTFWTFDYFHPGHEYYLSQARLYGDSVVTVIARDETVARVKGTPPDHDEHFRKLAVMKSRLSDLVVLWDREHYYSCLSTFRPHVVCLGYDQRSFDAWIQAYCEHHALSVQIVRLPPFEPDRRKSSLIKQTR